jgi:hypothetical protein
MICFIDRPPDQVFRGPVLFGSFVKKLKRKNIITDAEALRKDYPQISPMTKIKSLKTKLKNGFLKICEICVICG